MQDQGWRPEKVQSGYFCEGSHSEPFEGIYNWGKGKISWIPDTQNPIRLEMVKLRPACLAPDLVKDTNCQKICSLLRRPETVQKTKKAIFLKMINKLFICKFFKDFTNDRKSTNKVIAFSCRSLPNILRYRDHTWNLPTIRTIRDSFRHINNLTNMYESSGSMAFSSNLLCAITFIFNFIHFPQNFQIFGPF